MACDYFRTYLKEQTILQNVMKDRLMDGQCMDRHTKTGRQLDTQVVPQDQTDLQPTQKVFRFP